MYGQPRSLEELLSVPENRQRVRRGILGMEDGPPAPGVALEQPDELTEIAPAASLETPDPFTEIARRYMEAQAKGRAADRLSGLNEGFKDATETILSPRGVKLGRSAAPASEEAKARQTHQDELGAARTKAEVERKGQSKAGGSKTALSTDPSSPESKRYQGAFRAQYPGTPEEVLSAITEANYDNFRVSLDARSGLQSREKLGADALGQREKERLQRAYQFARTDERGWAALGQDEQQFFLNRVDREAAAAAKAAKDAEGQTVPAGEAASIGQAKTAVRALSTLGAQFEAKGASGVGGKATALLPWDTDPKQYEDDVLAAAQAVGTILEGGKLAAGDEVKYRKMFPAAGDSLERARNKLANVKRLVEDLTGEKIEALGAAGFNVKGFKPPKAAPAKVPPTGAGTGNRSPEPAGTTGTGAGGDDKVRVMINGAPKRIPRANLEAARALAKQRGDTLEVTDG